MNPSPDWTALERLRGIFLNRTASRGTYWRSRSDLASYDATFGERIGWKWDAVLAELKRRGWTLPPGPVLDFGCGSGIAGRRVLAAFSAAPWPTLWLQDRSPLAVSFAMETAATVFPAAVVEPASREVLDGVAPIGTLVVSHVLNELRAPDCRRLLALARRSTAVLWVEPGTHADSQALIGVRESLRPELCPVAPCPHAATCGLLVRGMERHWCHHFAAPPSAVLADPDWTQFARRMGVDLRSLPYSYLVLDRRAAGIPESGWTRVVGTPRWYKGHARVFACDRSGVKEVRLTERKFPEVFDSLSGPAGHRWVRWTVAGDEVEAVQEHS
ncbi:MAG: hypothetical protein J0L84_17255 [Verrucomicrobia bacterium]|nr:hypothetical protein [Verrucomicrobiota bacterium]